MERGGLLRPPAAWPRRESREKRVESSSTVQHKEVWQRTIFGHIQKPFAFSNVMQPWTPWPLPRYFVKRYLLGQVVTKEREGNGPCRQSLQPRTGLNEVELLRIAILPSSVKSL